MTLGEWLKNYRQEHGLSIQNMADRCGFSKAYGSILERGINPTTNKPISPTMQTIEKIARATGQDVDSLLKALDGTQPITLNPHAKTLTLEETNILNLYRALGDSNQNLIAQILVALGNTEGRCNV